MQYFQNVYANLVSHPFLQKVYFGNSLASYVLAIGGFLFLMFAFSLFQGLVLRRLENLAKRTKTDIDDVLVEIVRSIRPPFYSFLALFLMLQALAFHAFVKKTILVLLLIYTVYQITVVVQLLIDFVVRKRMNYEHEAAARSAAGILGGIAKVIVWTICGLFILSNIGVNITSMVAGLGIGGIAIAFALQSILSDLFSSFAIFFDKPFVPGDFIIVGAHMGTVEKIGIKTTRLRALGGEELVISNQELTSARVQNYKRMQERRVVMHFGIVYQTPTKKMEKIPETVKGVVEGIEHTRFDRAHFKQFGESTLDYEVVYYVLNSDYTEHMDIQQKIAFKIKQSFEKDGIHFAFPTRTLYMEKTHG